MGIGVRLKELLKERKITVKQLAECSGVSENTLYGIIKRDNKTLNPEIATKIAIALGVKPYDIMGIAYYDSITDLKQLRKDISQAENFDKLFISMYGETEYNSFMKYSVLTEEGQEKVKSYIDDLFTNPNYRIDNN